MSGLIRLKDVDRPEEPLTAKVECLRGDVLTLSVPGTTVRFNLYRRDGRSYFEGPLGGRYFIFESGAGEDHISGG